MKNTEILSKSIQMIEMEKPAFFGKALGALAKTAPIKSITSSRPYGAVSDAAEKFFNTGYGKAFKEELTSPFTMLFGGLGLGSAIAPGIVDKAKGSITNAVMNEFNNKNWYEKLNLMLKGLTNSTNKL